MNKKAARKSIVSNFTELSTMIVEVPQGGSSGLHTSMKIPVQVERVGAGIIGATQRTLTDIREERDRLQDLLDAGGSLEVHPELIDPSPYPDRLPDDNDVDFTALKQLIASEGQKVPIEVRRNPDSPDRYQVVYGHRRWRAARDLQILVKVRVVDLSDRELAIAQGIENSARQDLTWIEKALFAWRMEDAGIKARDIRAALGIDDPELARFRAVCRTITAPVIEAIGRAPKAGRPRWTELANALKVDPAKLDLIGKTLAGAKASSSDQRFKDASALAKGNLETGLPVVALRTSSGQLLGKAMFSGSAIRLHVDKPHASAFAQFLMGELPELLERFLVREGET